MRHIVNFGLLLSFCTLAISGAMAFWLPFSIVTTRVHINFGMATAVLVFLHLASRIPYFKSQLSLGKKSQISGVTLCGIISGWAVLLASALWGWQLSKNLVAQGYEARNRATIVRTSPLAGFEDFANRNRLVARSPGEQADAGLALYIRFDETLTEPPTLAVWAESTTGAMIETIYLDPRLCYAEQPTWGGAKMSRAEILPIWRHRYTLVSGIDPSGEFDGLTQATPTHEFTLDSYLQLGGAKEFVLCAEVNIPADPNDAFPNDSVGQPSLLYTAYIELDSAQPYSLLELTGHGGGSEKSGATQYDLDRITSAKSIVDLLLAKTEQSR